MATGGTGDILTGIVSGLLGQFPKDHDRAIAGAVYLHGLAGQIAARHGRNKRLLRPICSSISPRAYVPSRTFRTRSEEETIALGRSLAAELSAGAVLLIGELGAGKTTLAKGIVEGRGGASADEVSSPTFTLIHQYGDGLPHRSVSSGRSAGSRETSVSTTCSPAGRWCCWNGLSGFPSCFRARERRSNCVPSPTTAARFKSARWVSILHGIPESRTSHS